MIPAECRDNQRILFFDNIRYLMVLLVVVLHVACGYSHYLPYWPVNDDNSAFFDFVLRFLGVFLMPTLFFVAGFFALPSLHRKSTWLFIKCKFIRLGVPWLVGVVLLGPVHTYIHEYSRGFEGLSLWRFFIIKFQDAMTFRTGFINSIDQFSHLHFWFLSLLLFFFVVLALLHHGKRQRSETLPLERRIESPSNKSILSVLFLASVMATVLTLIMHLLFTKDPKIEPWVTIASVVQFQPTRVCLYGICFSLGIYAFSKNWFSGGKTPGHLVFWVLLTLALWFAREMVLVILLSGFTMMLGVIHETIRTFFVFSILMTLIAFGKQYWQSGSSFNRSLAKNSYTIYLIHLVIVLLVQLLMYKWWDVSIYFKFAIGSVSSLMLSYLFSEFTVRRYPRSSIAGMVGMFAVLAVILNSG